MDTLTIAIASALIALFWSVNCYEIYFFIRVWRDNCRVSVREETFKTKVQTEGYENGMRLSEDNKLEIRMRTEPIVFEKEVLPRNCLSFYEIDCTHLAVN